MVAQAEVTAVQADGLSLRLLETPVYCDDGLECAAADFPVELSWAAGTACEARCGGCIPLAVGERAIFLVNRNDGCLYESFKVDGTEVDCHEYSAPVEFVLAQVLDASCISHTVESGYWSNCNDQEDCSDSTTGQGGGVVLALAIVLLLVRKVG
ncbi:MAG TPA: hypothetical protein PK668_25010 [Myxococcota bacterium]|nr:hypothetical protein [Myxococcota bacterium]HRY96798.1 hypothetical protein [Myxococcota bacterium]